MGLRDGRCVGGNVGIDGLNVGDSEGTNVGYCVGERVAGVGELVVNEKGGNT